MSFFTVLYTLILSPLELLFEVVFTIANRIIGNPGLSIIFLSLAFNFLVLPLYKRADELQAEERDIQARMAPRLKRIKSTFKGDERFFMIQEYYRINHYKPIYQLKSSVSLLLQIPFFIAAYRLLSRMQCLQGMSFGFIADLGKEDATFMVGSFPINVLPILMTLINIVSGIIYTKGHPLKSKIQVYGLALVFLVLLYHSPSGLVFYWLLNNVFSLVKNIFYKLKNPKKVLFILSTAAGAGIAVMTFLRQGLDLRQKVLLWIFALLLVMPLIFSFIKKNQKNTAVYKSDKTFYLGCIFMALLTGLLIPASVVNASVLEFVNTASVYNPINYVLSSLLLSVGCFVIWGSIFYFFMSDRIKAALCNAMCIISVISLADYLLFGTKLGIISSTLQYDTDPSFKLTEYILNTITVIALAIVLYALVKKFAKFAELILIVEVVTVAGIGIINCCGIFGSFTHFYSQNYKESFYSEPVSIPLSTEGKNVIVLMLDRALGSQVPYIFNEKPELLEKFDGFTYYPNTISYGAYTNFATPALYGGYEYTPERMNEQTDRLLVDKHNEALKVMPVLFSNNGYTVTICDPSYANYQEIPDLSIYDDYPDFNCYITNGRFSLSDEDETDDNDSVYTEVNRRNAIRNRNFFCYALMKISPLLLQETIYDDGAYNEATIVSADANRTINLSPLQHTYGISRSNGISNYFAESYPVLVNLANITEIRENSQNTFLMMSNTTTHSPCLLQEPDYLPSLKVDNTAYDSDMESRYTVNGVTMEMTDEEQVIHYHVNMATFLKLGEWFDYLREKGVYDNTRIILVADHGRDLGQFNISCNGEDMEFFMPLLMVKDFEAKGFSISEDFMTNGDTPTLATNGLIKNPTNPFTGKAIDSSAKTGPQKVFLSFDWNVSKNNGYTFIPGDWYVFNGSSPYDPDNWSHAGN